MSDKPFIDIRHAAKSFGALEVLKDINLTVERGQIVAIIGPSGSGKSTLLRAINELDPLTSGEVWLEGVQINKKLPHHQYEKHVNQVRQDIGMVFQHFNLFPHLNVRDNITLAPKMLKGMSTAAAKIGRASCRERVKIQLVCVTFKIQKREGVSLDFITMQR